MKDCIDVSPKVRYYVNKILHGDAEIGSVPELYQDLVIQIIAGGVTMKPEVSK